jgi:hypothetical protein
MVGSIDGGGAPASTSADALAVGSAVPVELAGDAADGTPGDASPPRSRLHPRT